ncbi:hypothetical protein [Pseudoduganella umbonata]|uniref:Sodium:proline symporter n=2 Tax=Pseudoduganella umbonata TaxID=864828 RepID=A0A7W5ECB0_9BURK|nr:hypothetical protein [Pseudoduganella umbonata]MBB3222516.1 hypothetical protein [Pseudoduganella umbonata]
METHGFSLRLGSHLNAYLHRMRVQSHRWTAREPDWAIGALAGFGAGGIVMLMELAFAAAIGTDPWRVPRLVAALALGSPVLQVGGYSLEVLVAALAVHYLLGTFFGLVLAALMAPFHLDSSVVMAVVAGAVFGLLLYLFNFYVITSVLPWFAEMRGWVTVLGHVEFGVMAGLIYRMLERRR